jgi:hypothetical protein
MTPAHYCGDNTVDDGEICDGDCPKDCDDKDPCTADTMTGQANHCDVACEHDAITVDKGGDGCCLTGHLAKQDSDCKVECNKNADCGADTSVCLGPICNQGKCETGHVFAGLRCTTNVGGNDYPGACNTKGVCRAFVDGGCIATSDCPKIASNGCEAMECQPDFSCKIVKKVGNACVNNGTCQVNGECANCKTTADCPSGQECIQAGSVVDGMGEVLTWTCY